MGAGLSSSAKDRLKDIKDFLEMKNDSAVDAVEQAKSENSSSRTSYDTRFTREHDDEYLDHNTQTSSCRFCNGSNCKVEYGGLGCLEIYNLDTRKQRCDWLMGHKLCIKCGLDFKSKHKCGWSGRLFTKCSNSNCLLASATCDNKVHKNKLSKELFQWLKSQKVNIKNLAQVVISSYTRGANLDPKGSTSGTTSRNRSHKISTTPIQELSNEEREGLQSGKLCRPMNENNVMISSS